MSACRERILCIKAVRTVGVGCEDRTIECTEAREAEFLCIGQVEQNAFTTRTIVAFDALTVERTAACRDREFDIIACDVDNHVCTVGHFKIDGRCCPRTELREREQVVPFLRGEIPDIGFFIALTCQCHLCFILCLFGSAAVLLLCDGLAGLTQRIKRGGHINHIIAVDLSAAVNVNIRIRHILADDCAGILGIYAICNGTVLHINNRIAVRTLREMCADTVSTDAVQRGKFAAACKHTFTVRTLCGETVLNEQRVILRICEQAVLIHIGDELCFFRVVRRNAFLIVISKARDRRICGNAQSCRRHSRSCYGFSDVPFFHNSFLQ